VFAAKQPRTLKPLAEEERKLRPTTGLEAYPVPHCLMIRPVERPSFTRESIMFKSHFPYGIILLAALVLQSAALVFALWSERDHVAAVPSQPATEMVTVK